MPGASYIDLKRIDELLDQARTLHGDNVPSGVRSPSQSAEGDSDSDFEFPAVNFNPLSYTTCLLIIFHTLSP